MPDVVIEFESTDCTFVLYSDASWDVFDDEGQRLYGGSFGLRDLRELEELVPSMRDRQADAFRDDRKEPH